MMSETSQDRMTSAEIMTILESHDRSIESIDKCLERDSRAFVGIQRRINKNVLATIDLRERMDAMDRSIALIHLAMAMLLGLSAGAFVISLLGAVS